MRQTDEGIEASVAEHKAAIAADDPGREEKLSGIEDLAVEMRRIRDRMIREMWLEDSRVDI